MGLRDESYLLDEQVLVGRDESRYDDGCSFHSASGASQTRSPGFESQVYNEGDRCKSMDLYWWREGFSIGDLDDVGMGRDQAASTKNRAKSRTFRNSNQHHHEQGSVIEKALVRDDGEVTGRGSGCLL